MICTFEVPGKKAPSAPLDAGSKTNPAPEGKPSVLPASQGIHKDVVREIPLPSNAGNLPVGDSLKPVTIRNAEELAKVFTDKKLRDEIALQADFDNKYLFYFGWNGSLNDKLTFGVESGQGTTVVFQYRVGRETERIPTRHFHLYAISKGVGWRVEDGNDNILFARETPTVRELDLTGSQPAERPKGTVFQPARIISAQDLAKAFPDKAWQEKIAKQVDFSKEYLLFFGWDGDVVDTLTFEIEHGKQETAVFQYRTFTGAVRRSRARLPHFHLYAIPEHARWRVEEKGSDGQVLPSSFAHVIREIDLKGPQDKLPINSFTIRNAEDLAKIFTDKKLRDEIASQADFDHEFLLYFGWIGSPGDSLTFGIENDKQGTVVVFQSRQGKGQVGEHFHLYAIAKAAIWRIEDGNGHVLSGIETRQNPPVRELDLAGFQTDVQPNNSVFQPARISSVQELPKIFQDKAWQEKIARQVNFSREYLLFFAWGHGSLDDKLTYAMEQFKAVREPLVVFHFQAGTDRAPKPHFHLYAIAKDVIWRIEDGNGNILSGKETPAVRELDLTGLLDNPSPPPMYISFHEPRMFTSAQHLADKKERDKIAPQVDFDKEIILSFEWTGSGTVTFKIEQGKNGPIIVFKPAPGGAGRQVSHHVFAVPKDARWRTENDVGEPLHGNVVREIAWKGKLQRGDPLKPAKITNAEELAKVIPDKTQRDKIAQQMNFTNIKPLLDLHYLLAFGWSGSGGDRLTFRVERFLVEHDKLGTEVVFQLRYGKEDNKALHSHLYAIAKDRMFVDAGPNDQPSWRVEVIDSGGKVLPTNLAPREEKTALGVEIEDVINALQIYQGAYYVNAFNTYGRTWQVFIPIDPATLAAYEKLGGVYGGMKPEYGHFEAGREHAENGLPGFHFANFPKEKLPAVDVPFCLDFRGCENVPNLQELAGLTNLVALDLGRTGVRAAQLKELANLKNLRWLQLEDTLPRPPMMGGYRNSMNDATLRSLHEIGMLHVLPTAQGKNGERPRSEDEVISLSVGASEVTDACIKELAGLKNLGELNLAGNKITPKGLRDLAPFKNLTLLFINLDSWDATDETFRVLREIGLLHALWGAREKATSVPGRQKKSSPFHSAIRRGSPMRA